MSASAPAPGTILVVDDNLVNSLMLGRGLEQQGHTVVFAEHGRAALDLLRHRHFDLMLLDVLMPELDGYQVLAELKLDPHLREIPVIMTSSLDELDSVVKCIEMGAEDYLTAEVVYAVTHEGARHLDDVLTRRTRISIETWDRGIHAAWPAARLMARQLGWDTGPVPDSALRPLTDEEAE